MNKYEVYGWITVILGVVLGGLMGYSQWLWCNYGEKKRKRKD